MPLTSPSMLLAPSFGLAMMLAASGCAQVDAGGETGETGETGGEEVGGEENGGEVGGGPCTSNAECLGTEVCLSEGVCADAFNHQYEIYLNELNVNSRKENGDDWDPLGADPDPFWTLEIGQTEVYESPVASPDSGNLEVDYRWQEGRNVTVEPDFRFAIVIKDDDAVDDDDIGIEQWSSLPAQVLHDGGHSGSGPNGDWYIRFELLD